MASPFFKVIVMTKSFQTKAMLGFIALVVVTGFFGPYLLSLLLVGILALCWLFAPREADPPAKSSLTRRAHP